MAFNDTITYTLFKPLHHTHDDNNMTFYHADHHITQASKNMPHKF